MSAPTVDGLEAARARVAEFVASLSPDEVEALAAGRGRLVYRPVVDGFAGQLAELLDAREQHDAVPGPRAHRQRGVHPSARQESSRDTLGIDVSAVVARINGCGSAVEVAGYLAGLDARHTVPVLREIARALGPTVNATGRTKAQLRRDIVEGTAGFRERSSAMSGGAWG